MDTVFREELLQLAAFATIEDIMDLLDENRPLVKRGLELLNTRPVRGIRELIEVLDLAEKKIFAYQIGFMLGPCINASGRMQNGTEAVDLLVERDFEKALAEANHINEYNEQRKDVDKQMTEEANQIVEKLESQKHHASIVLYDENWKKGVIGIVASRLTELYYRPTVVLTKFNGIATGSARSVAGYDVYDAIKSCRDLLENFGGHTYAVGLSLKIENIPEFRRRFQKYVTEHIQPEQTEATLDINAVIDFKDVTKKLHNDLKKFAPHGPDNPKPLFCTRNVYDYGTSKVVGRQQEHIKLELVDSKSSNVLNGIAFGQTESARFIKSKRSFDIVYTIEDNIYKRSEVQLQIEDIKPSEE
jgi:single-stranded-DNA-specific exonuclease